MTFPETSYRIENLRLRDILLHEDSTQTHITTHTRVMEPGSARFLLKVQKKLEKASGIGGLTTHVYRGKA